jgi:lysophospholipase L1-like esterase
VKVKAVLQNVALAAVTSAVFLGALELGARLVEKPTPAAAPVADYIWDWREKMPGDFYVIRSEAVGWPPWEEINADGLRDRTHPTEKPPGRARLVALGDSVTLGAGIAPAEAYPQQLEALLRREGRLVDVMNVGLWGWSTRQERLAYERIVRRYRPDRVILAVCLNDLPELQNNLARPPVWLAALFRGSALVRRLVNAQGREIQNVEQMFTEPEAPRVREAYTRFFAEVEALRDAVRKDGAAFGLAVFPFRFQVLPGAPAPLAQREIEGFCRRSSIPFLDLLPVLKPLGEGGFVDYDHLSALGAARTAEALAASDLVPRELCWSRRWARFPTR